MQRIAQSEYQLTRRFSDNDSKRETSLKTSYCCQRGGEPIDSSVKVLSSTSSIQVKEDNIY